MDVLGACGVVVAIVIARKRKRRTNRKIWVRDWIKNRPTQGAYHQLVQELQLTDTCCYRHFLQMDTATFEELLSKVGPLIIHEDTTISPGERLALTLRFLATGKSHN